jgi:hypothetical protein
VVAGVANDEDFGGRPNWLQEGRRLGRKSVVPGRRKAESSGRKPLAKLVAGLNFGLLGGSAAIPTPALMILAKKPPKEN